jgi:hypothetical protein
VRAVEIENERGKSLCEIADVRTHLLNDPPS